MLKIIISNNNNLFLFVEIMYIELFQPLMCWNIFHSRNIGIKIKNKKNKLKLIFNFIYFDNLEYLIHVLYIEVCKEEWCNCQDY